MPPDASDNPPPDDRGSRLRSLRKKLAKLNRGPMADRPPARPEPAPPQASPRGASPESIVYRRNLPRVEAPRVPTGGGISIPLEKCVQGCETPCSCGPAFHLIEVSVVEAEPECPELPTHLACSLEALSQGLPFTVRPEDVCFLDIETTGLGTALTFLIGTLVWHEGDIVCRQYLARTYAEEVSILAHFAETFARTPFVVTFNGKTFDVPSLRARAAATGVVLPEARFHFDLLHEARRRYRDRLPDCKLQTLERRVCGRHRHDDIPGSEIGRAYHDFVRTGDAREIAQIVQHNQWDLVTMVHLLARMVLVKNA